MSIPAGIALGVAVLGLTGLGVTVVLWLLFGRGRTEKLTRGEVRRPFARSTPAPDPERERAAASHREEMRRIRTAIKSGVCPACGAAMFRGTETFQNSVSFAGGGGGQVYALTGACDSCGARESGLDLR